MKNINHNTDKDWKKWGKSDPYFGVLTSDEFKKENLDEQRLNSFFETGQHFIDGIVKNIRRYIHPEFNPATAVDFGCGTGRLIIPISKFAKKAIGIDISEHMLEEVRKNSIKYNIHNIETYISDDSLSCLQDVKYDFVNSYIVMQHIPVERGYTIFRQLLKNLNQGGVGVLHFTFKNHAVAKGVKVYKSLEEIFSFLTKIRNLIKGRAINSPNMSMNEYSLATLMDILHQHDIKRSYVELTDHGGVLGAIIYFIKE